MPVYRGQVKLTSGRGGLLTLIIRKRPILPLKQQSPNINIRDLDGRVGGFRRHRETGIQKEIVRRARAREKRKDARKRRKEKKKMQERN